MTDDAVPDLRASDADRERVAAVLQDAVAEGRLDLEEFEERLDATYRARTYRELEPITRDLPAPGVSAPVVDLTKSPEPGGDWASRVGVGGDTPSTWAVAVMSGFQRKGRWTAPRRFNCFAFWGGGEIDLREADFADREIVINAVAIMGGVDIIVPPGVEVVVRGVGIMGGFDHPEENVRSDPGAPRVIVSGLAFWGGVGVRRKLPRAQKQRLREERRREKLERRANRCDGVRGGDADCREPGASSSRRASLGFGHGGLGHGSLGFDSLHGRRAEEQGERRRDRDR
ncbi:DUF1707 SHOCT-like domain-containing protein [Streptomyces sp. KMM 9044]|uniref:DUF1707 SHOCT-like domain-containing protein n=1 Tax=Streptomyces sp. KMM 9044 TaxID=2744474 RepID=UPI002151DF9B|nr:DUF1707 domain-containing protein [Streptomyces sp. KMM 9044]WAX79807.1 DUF1707 domain-containing protein [Streptomyces sp. KMM 9044]